MSMESTTHNRSEIWPETIAQAPVGFFIIFLSAFVFYLASLLTSKLIPGAASHAPWRWKNISISLVHASVSGTWALLWWDLRCNFDFQIVSGRFFPLGVFVGTRSCFGAFFLLRKCVLSPLVNSGFFPCFCSFLDSPKLAEDLISTYSSFSYALISMSVGECCVKLT